MLLILSLLTACQTIDDNAISSVTLDKEGFHLLFFSNNQNNAMEEAYYDVLLDLRKEFPREMANLYLVQQSKSSSETIKRFNITSFPTLVIIKDGQEIKRISGQKNRQQLHTELKAVISNK